MGKDGSTHSDTLGLKESTTEAKPPSTPPALPDLELCLCGHHTTRQQVIIEDDDVVPWTTDSPSSLPGAEGRLFAPAVIAWRD